MKTIQEMAHEAGFKVGSSHDGPDDVWGVVATLECFAKLVREDERELCAKVCEEMVLTDGLHQAKYCANSIRARSNT